MKSILYFLFALFLFTSCEDQFSTVLEVDLEDHESKLAIIAHFANTDTVLQVFVSNSLGILDTQQYDQITDATVQLFKNGSFAANFTYNVESGQYETPNTTIVTTAADQFELVVSNEQYGTVRAFQQMPKAASFDRFHAFESVDETGYPISVFNYTFKDDGSSKNYYRLSVFAEQWYFDGEDTVRYSNKAYLYPPDFTSTYAGADLILTDESFNGQSAILRANSYNEIPGEEEEEFGWRIFGVLSAITEDHYRYLLSVSRTEDSEYNPFVEPVIIHQNIEGGHGMFSVSNAGIRELE